MSNRAAIAGRLDAERDRCVEEAGAVEVDGEPDLARRRDDSSSSASGQTRPPELLCVSSSARIAARWSATFVLGSAAARTCSGVRRPRSPGSPSVMSPACAAAPPYS